MRFVGLLCVLALTSPAWSQAKKAHVGGPVNSEGVEVQVELPPKFHLKNRGGSDGAGLCVFASLKHASIWQQVEQTVNIFEYMFTRPGGGWPEKVDKVIEIMCKEKGVPVPDYVQYQGRDVDFLMKALTTGRMVGVTYAYSPTGRYGGRKVAHMVNLVHADGTWFAILDNNFPGTIEWMDRAAFLRAWTGGGGNGWAVVFLNPSPPPVPRAD